VDAGIPFCPKDCKRCSKIEGGHSLDPPGSVHPHNDPSSTAKSLSMLLKNVAGAPEARRNEAEWRSLHLVNEHFEPNIYAAFANAVVLQQPAQDFLPNTGENSTRWKISPGRFYCFRISRSMKDEIFEKRLILFKVKEGENFNHRNTLKYFED